MITTTAGARNISAAGNNHHLMNPIAATLVAFLVAASSAQGADSESERSSRAIQQYARCLDSAVGNFRTDAETQLAANKLAKAMLLNIRSLISLERSKPNAETKFLIDALGEEGFVGYMFRAFEGGNKEYRSERQTLMARNKSDWRLTHQQLWSTYGCDAILSELSR